MATKLTKATWGAFIGSSIEWYDFFIYGTASALIFNQLFFPEGNPVLNTVLSLLTFAAGFLARPIGAMIFGYYGDRLGRKNTFIVTLLVMGVATVAIGLLPTYETIGMAAPILLVLLRVIQGIGVGGEWGGSILVTIENAPPKKRAFFGVAPQLGSPMGTIMANGAFFLVATLPEEQLLSWGWRVPFLASSVLIIVALILRMSLGETDDFAKQAAAHGVSKNPVKEVLTQAWGRVLLVAGARLFELSGFTIATVFVATYVVNSLGGERADVLAGVFWGGVAELVALPVFALLMLRVRAKSMIYAGAILGILISFPFFMLLNLNTSTAIIAAMVMWFPVISIPFAAYPTVFAELFPSSIRYTGISLGYQAVSLFSGFVPVLLVSLYAFTGSWISIPIFTALTAVVSIGCVIAMRRVKVETRSSLERQAAVSAQELLTAEGRHHEG